MAFVCQITSAIMSGISGSAQADAAVMTPLLVPAMEKEGYDRDVAAAVVAGASIKGPVGPISVMFIAYGYIVSGIGQAPINQMLSAGLVLVIGLLVLQGASSRSSRDAGASALRTGFSAGPKSLGRPSGPCRS